MLHCNIFWINNSVKETNKNIRNMAMNDSTIIKVSKAAHFVTLALLVLVNSAFLASVA